MLWFASLLYRIYIPALEKDGVTLSIEVEADNWMLALRYGLDEIGADRDLIKRAICDIKTDMSIHVMEPAGGHVFILSEVPSSDRPTVGETPAVTDEMLANADAPLPTPTPVAAWAMEETAPQELGTAHTVDNIPMEADGPVDEEDDEDIPVAEEIDYPLREADLEKYFDAPTGPAGGISHLDLAAVVQDEATVVGREPTADQPIRDFEREVSKTRESKEELFARVFEEMAEIDFVGETVEDALSYALELAVQRIPSEAGWLLLADLNRRDLYFATATGPKAEEVIDYRLPMGKGLAGFCAVNGVSLSLRDVENDPRFQVEISKQVGYKISSVACAPVQHDGRVYGAIQVMNHVEDSEYSRGELDVLDYIARRTAEYLSQHVEM